MENQDTASINEALEAKLNELVDIVEAYNEKAERKASLFCVAGTAGEARASVLGERKEISTQLSLFLAEEPSLLPVVMAAAVASKIIDKEDYEAESFRQ